ncbi:MAG: sialate O-acetylesterase [Myxococcota bacterium]
MSPPSSDAQADAIPWDASAPRPTVGDDPPVEVNLTALVDCEGNDADYSDIRHAWIVGGQSNALGRQIFPGFQEIVEARLPGITLEMIPSTRGGNPIENWDEGTENWRKLTERVTAAEFPVEGIVWYQGEANSFEPDGYDEKLHRFAARLRELTENPDFKVIIVQLANNGGPNKGPFLAILRELQARYADGDRLAEIIPALDSTMNDGVHINMASRHEVGRRAGVAALHLAYGIDCATTPGPRFLRQHYVDAGRSAVVVEFSGVYGTLNVADTGWENGFGAIAGGVPEWSETTLPSSEVFRFDGDELLYPEQLEVRTPNSVLLTFDAPLPEGTMLGWATAGNQRASEPFGDDRRANTPMAGLKDAEGFPPLAYFPRPIELPSP